VRPVEAVKTCFQKYADFRGAATRPEYWWFFLFNLVVSIVLAAIGLRVLTTIYSLGVLVPGLAVMTRRHHDAGRSGWWGFTVLVWPWALVLLAYPSKQVGNKYVTDRGPAGTSDAALSTGTGYCPVCGKVRLPGQTFCTGCGAKFDQ
jgi:uncharacterized membrane protein YhaH (DUF805 family)